MVASRQARHWTALVTAGLLIGLSAPNDAEAADRARDAVRGPGGEVAHAAACGSRCVPARSAPLHAGLDCHWEHVRVPADRFTVLVRRVRVCY